MTTATAFAPATTKAMGFDSLVDYIKKDFYSTPQESPTGFNCRSIKLAEDYANESSNRFVPVSSDDFGGIEGYWIADFIAAEHQAFKEIEVEWSDEDYWGLPFEEAVALLG